MAVQPRKPVHSMYEPVEVMFVTVWYPAGFGSLMGADEPVRLDAPVCDLRLLFPGSVAVTLSGDDVEQLHCNPTLLVG